MPKIPQFFADDRLQPNNMAEEAMNKEAYHEERTAEVVPHLWKEGLDEFGKGLDKFNANQDQDGASGSGGSAAKLQEQAATASMMQDMATLTVQAHKNLDETLNTANPADGSDPLEKFNASLQTQLQTVGEKYSGSPRTQAAFERMSDRLQTSLLDRGYSQWQSNVKGFTANSLKTTADQFANAAATDPASVDILAQQYSASIETASKLHPGMFSVDQQQKLTRSGMESIYNSAGMQLVHQINSNPNASIQDVQKVKDILAGDNFRNNMSPEDYSRVLDDMGKAVTVRQDAASIYIEKSAPQILDQVRQNGDPSGRWGRMLSSTAVHTPEQLAAATVRTDDYNAALMEHKVGKDIGDMPNDQVQQYIQQRKTEWQSAQDPAQATVAHRAYDMAVKVAKERDEEFMKSPSTYMLNHNDTVGALYAKYQQKPNAQNFQTYAMFSSAQQEKLYPHEPPQVLTDDMKQDIKSKMAAIDQTPQGALQAAATLNQLRDLTGTFYTGAIHELMKDKIIRPDQYVAGTLSARPESQMLAQEVLQAAAVPGDTMNKVSPLDEAHAVSVARAAFAPLAQTMRGTVNGDDLLNAYVSSAAQVLRQRAVAGGQQYLGTKFGGQIASDAAQLANQMVLGRIQVKGGMRIPVGMDADDVNHGAQSVLGDLGNHKLVSPPYYGGLINGGQQFAKDIQSSGYWVTNPKGDGAILYFQGAPVQERGPKGTVQTISIPFATMQKLGQQSRSTTDKVGRFFTNPGSL